ncbi:MAG: hypothetical protein HY925_10390, partial [Elusimicrobia bacterium]|nr:hypothetical protein [Elusimicrobiota bacterium]
ELKPWLRELAAKESATGLPWENDRTRLVGQTPPPKPSVPGLEPILPPAGPDAAERFKRPVEPRQPTLPIFKTSTRRVSNLAAGLASFSVVLVVGTLAMMLSGSCSGPTPDRTPKARKRYVVPANP